MEYAQNLILDINPQTGLTTNSKNVIKLRLLRNSQFPKWLSECSESLKNWIISNNLEPKPGSILRVPDKDMRILEVIAIVGNENNFWDISRINKLNYHRIISDSVNIDNHSEVAKMYIQNKTLYESNYYKNLIVKVSDIKNLI